MDEVNVGARYRESGNQVTKLQLYNSTRVVNVINSD